MKESTRENRENRWWQATYYKSEKSKEAKKKKKKQKRKKNIEYLPQDGDERIVSLRVRRGSKREKKKGGTSDER